MNHEDAADACRSRRGRPDHFGLWFGRTFRDRHRRSTATTTEKLTGRDKAVRFAECMRENGVREFPDPDASGELTIDGVVNGSTLDPDSPAWKGAIGACKDLQPSGFTGHKRTPGSRRPPCSSPSASARTAWRTSRTPPRTAPGRHEPDPVLRTTRRHDRPQRRDAEVRRRLAGKLGLGNR